MSNSTQISMGGSPIKHISAHCDLHSSSVSLYVELNTNDEQTTQRIIGLAAEVGVTLKKLSSSSDSRMLISKTIAPLDDFFYLLLGDDLVDENGWTHLMSEMVKVTTAREKRQYIKDVVTAKQTDLIIAAASYFIKALVDDTQNYRDLVPLIVCTMQEFGATDLWRRRLQQHPGVNVEASVDCMKRLSMIMQGKNTDLSQALMDTGAGVPMLGKQRPILIDAIKKAFDAKYGETRNNEFEGFYLDFAMEKLLRGEFPHKHLSASYYIACDNGFPEVTSQKWATNILFDESKPLPNAWEQELLRKHGLTRFPISVEDMTSARAGELGDVIKLSKDAIMLRRLIDIVQDFTPGLASTASSRTPEMAQWYYGQGLASKGKGHFKDAICSHKTALDMRRGLFGDADPSVSESLKALMDAYFAQKETTVPPAILDLLKQRAANPALTDEWSSTLQVALNINELIASGLVKQICNLKPLKYISGVR